VDGKSPKDPNVACEGSGTVRRRIEPEPSGNGSTTRVLRPMNDDREPIDVLYSIEQEVSNLSNERCLEDLEPRLNPDPGELTYKVLHYIKENGPITSTELGNQLDCLQSRILSRLYQTFLVDREPVGNQEFSYSITPVGEKALETEQVELINNGPQTVSTEPWVSTDLNRGEYYAIKLVNEHEDAPTPPEIEDRFQEYGYESNTDSLAVSARLSELKNTPYVDRTPHEPYRYWVTEEGKELLED